MPFVLVAVFDVIARMELTSWLSRDVFKNSNRHIESPI